MWRNVLIYGPPGTGMRLLCCVNHLIPGEAKRSLPARWLESWPAGFTRLAPQT